ncbi:MAG: hypothetical protein QM477_07355 [Planctomycetota bacterium]
MRHSLLLVFIFVIGGLFYWTCALSFSEEESADLNEPTMPLHAAELELPNQADTEEVSRERLELGGPEIPAAGVPEEVAVSQPKLLVRLISGETGEPIAHASVWTYQRNLERRERSMWDVSKNETDPEVLAAEYSEEYFSDVHGHVEVPEIGDNQVFVARKGELFGYSFQFPSQMRVLKMWQDQSLQVKVVDAFHRPIVGMPVCLASVLEERVFPILDSRVLSNQEGIAHIPHLSHWASTRPASRLRVHPLVLLQHPVLAGIPSGNETMTLTLPAMGQVVVVDDVEAKQPGLSVQMAWDANPGTGWHRDARKWNNAEKGVFANTMSDGRSVYPFVGLDMRLVVSVRTERGREQRFGFGWGPRVADEEVLLQMEAADPDRVVQVQVLDESREPIRNQDLLAGYQTGNSHHSGDALYPTDADGVVRIEIDAASYSSWFDATTVLDLQTAPSFDGKPMRGSLALGALLPGVKDLGRLRLDSSQLLISGRVVNEAGEPQQGLMLFASSHYEQYDSFDFAFSKKDGSFVLFGNAHGPEFELEISAEGFLPYHETLLAGSYQTEIVLQKGGQLVGRVLFDPAIPANVFAMRFLADGSTSDPRILGLDDDGTFHAEGLVVSAGRLDLIHEKQATVFASFDFVLPVWNSGATDARLAEIDMRGKVVLAKVRVKNTLGEAIPYARIQGHEERKNQMRGFCNSLGDADLFLPGGDFPALVLAPGMTSQEVRLQGGVQEIVLEEGIEVWLQLDPPPSLPPGVTVKARMESRQWGSRAGATDFDAKGVAMVKLPSTGPFRCLLWLYKEGMSLGKIRTINNPYLEIGESSRETPVMVSVDLEMVSKVLARPMK